MSAQFDPILGQVRDGTVTLAEQTAGFNKGTAAEQATFQSLVSGAVPVQAALSEDKLGALVALGLGSNSAVKGGDLSAVNTIMVSGDSISAYNYLYVTNPSISGNGTYATYSGATAHFTAPGSLFYLGGFAQPEYNGFFVVRSVTTANAFTFVSAGPAVTFPATASNAPGTNSQMVLHNIKNAAGFVHGANSILFAPFLRVYVTAIGGQRGDQILARMAADIAAVTQVNGAPPGIILVQGVINSVFQGTGTVAEDAAIMQTVTSRVALALSTCGRCILATCTPFDDSAAYPNVAYRAAHRKQILRINAWMRSYAASTPGVILFDHHAALVDPATGAARAGYLFDGIHPSDVGGGEGARELQTTLAVLQRRDMSRILVSSPLDVWTQAGDRQVAPNPLLRGTSGVASTRVTGVVPNNCTLLCTNGSVLTAASSVVPRTKSADGDAIGNNWVMTLNNTGGVDDEMANGYMTIPAANLQAGDRIKLSVHVQVSGMTGAGLAYLNLIFSFGVGGITSMVSANQYQAHPTWSGDFNAVMTTEDITIPSGGLSAIYVFMRPALMAGATGVVKFGRVTLAKV